MEDANGSYAMTELPIKAKIKWQALIDAEQSAHDHLRAVADRVSSLSHALATAPASEAGSLEFELSRQRAKLSDGQRRHHFLANQNARVKHFLIEIVGTAHLEDVRAKPAKIETGETLAKAATRIRAKITALTAERQKVLSAALPIADLKKAAAEHVAALAERGRPKLKFGHGQEFRVTFDSMVSDAHTVQLDIAASLAYLDPAAFLQRIVEDIERMPKPALAMTVKARSEKLAALDLELLVLEHEDESICEASEIEGPIVQRRPDADPRAILAVQVMRGKPAPAKPAAKLDRNSVADPMPVNPTRRLSQKELIAEFGNNRLRSVTGE